MADHRVDDLRLRLRAGSASQENVRAPAESFVSGILEALGDHLELRWPGRLIFLRELQLRWKITETELSDGAAVSRYAGEIAASLGDPQSHRPGERMPAADLVAFRDEADWWACYLAALAAGNGDANAWTYDTLRAKGIDFGSLADRGSEFAGGVLTGLAEAGMLVRAVGMVGDAAVTRLCAVLGAAAPALESVRYGAVDATLIEAARALPAALSRPARWLVLYGEALRIRGANAAQEELMEMVNSAIDECAQPAMTRLAASAPGETRLEPSLTSQTAFDTEFGGLFYLLSIALEMDIGETLWKACLPEGAVLAHTAAALLGAASRQDPAAELFGGVPASQTLEVSPEQQEEVAAALAGSLVEALPRRSLARLPQVMLRMAPLAGSPALVAAEAGSPFALFVWPGGDARSVERGLQVFLAAWPVSAPRILGTPAIAALEGGVRVRSAPEVENALRLFAPEAGSPPASALIAQIAGVLCHVFAARAGFDPVPGAAALRDRCFALPARMTITPEEMVVKLPMSGIDPELRRSGLDRDPGWIPWLGRTVRFTFIGNAQEE